VGEWRRTAAIHDWAFPTQLERYTAVPARLADLAARVGLFRDSLGDPRIVEDLADMDDHRRVSAAPVAVCGDVVGRCYASKHPPDAKGRRLRPIFVPDFYTTPPDWADVFRSIDEENRPTKRRRWWRVTLALVSSVAAVGGHHPRRAKDRSAVPSEVGP
jgi:hypothetical protein